MLIKQYVLARRTSDDAVFCQTLYRDDGKPLGVIARYYEEGATCDKTDDDCLLCQHQRLHRRDHTLPTGTGRRTPGGAAPMVTPGASARARATSGAAAVERALEGEVGS